MEGLGKIKKIAAGPNFALALDSDGNLYAWGSNSYGAMAVDPKSESIVNKPREVQYFKDRNVKIRDISAGDRYGAVLVITEHKDVYGWGYNYYGQIKAGLSTTLSAPVYTGISRAVSVKSGKCHTSYALDEGGVIYAWGHNDYKEHGTQNPKTISTVDMGGKRVVAIGADYGSGFTIINGEELTRSEERRVGKECRSRWSPYH